MSIFKRLRDRKRNKNKQSQLPICDDNQVVLEVQPDVDQSLTGDGGANNNKDGKWGLFSKLKSGLTKTRQGFVSGVASLFLGRKQINDQFFEDLETQLLLADVGVESTQQLMEMLRLSLSRKQLKDSEVLFDALKSSMVQLLESVENPLLVKSLVEYGEKRPFVILTVGINGAGKTTTIGKLAKRLQSSGHKVMLAAGDTFRAAAVEQLKVWGERNNISVIAKARHADSASVIFDAMSSAKAKQIDVLIADTAGRLHTQHNLMEELKKIKRVIERHDSSAPHEILLVIDAGNGQNALNQARQFCDAIGVSGLCLTKLDGTAKGGVVFAISKQLGLPIRFIGLGEQIDDLRDFVADDFVQALFQD